MNTSTRLEVKDRNMNYLPPIPVALRHPMIVASVKQYRTESQNEQLQTHIVSESFIPMAPDLIKPPRKRRRPPFSYSSLIAQAILESENERMTLRDIYAWITSRYPALYNEKDTGWQVPFFFCVFFSAFFFFLTQFFIYSRIQFDITYL